jgi:hypothetical protein
MNNKSITDNNGTTYLYDCNNKLKSYRDKHGTIYNESGVEVGKFQLN